MTFYDLGINEGPMKIHVVGCGLTGITAAIVLKEQGHNVEVFESRHHLGGNCYDEVQDGVRVHQYGAHIFHTNDKGVWSFLNRYTRFNDYQHRVRANTKEGLISIPFNKHSEESLGRNLTDDEIRSLIFKDYSERHWGLAWEKLPKSILSRVSIRRSSYDSRYFLDKYQGIPEHGYTTMLQGMLDGVKVHLGVGKMEWRKFACDKVVYTGKPDDFYNYRYGVLPYRSLRFEHIVTKRDALYSWDHGAVINECNLRPYNRTVDNSVFHNQSKGQTVLTRDYPEEHDGCNEPIYPKPFGEGREIFLKYKACMDAENDTVFLGRLATYKYLDMWMAIKQVMIKFNYSI